MEGRVWILLLALSVSHSVLCDKGGIPHWQNSGNQQTASNGNGNHGNSPGRQSQLTAMEIPAIFRRYRHRYEVWWKRFQHDVTGCGQQHQSPFSHNLRVVGGQKSTIESWPWMVSLYSGLILQPWCAGTLIGRQWVVTAAHCFDGPFANPATWSLHFGKQNSSAAAEYSAEQVRQIAALTRHPGYDELASSFHFDNDIALIKLDSPVVFNDQISPLCLVRGSDSLTPGQPCTITGYGIVDPNNKGFEQNFLHEAEVPLVDKAHCARLDGYGDKVTDNMICAGPESGRQDTCYGDSGGPMQTKIRDKWHLIGVTSWGAGKNGYQGCALPRQPGVYTDVSKYTEWIYTKLFWDFTGGRLHDNGYHGQH